MTARHWLAVGTGLGALAYPVGLLVGHWLFKRSVLYPHT